MFLTLEDPRANVQGSRDPLGLQPIWSRFGREVVTNLTTVTALRFIVRVLFVGITRATKWVSLSTVGEEDGFPPLSRIVAGTSDGILTIREHGDVDVSPTTSSDTPDDDVLDLL